jgi:hypothetical protein
MISGNPSKRGLRRLLATAMLAATAIAAALEPETATPEAAALIERLARPAPATIAFTEVRFSPLLKAPLIVSGELGYSGPASLDRFVLKPYREHTAIRGESVRVEREGAPVRSFALKRAPELQGLLNGFTALLAGDAPAIERSFDMAVSENGESWRLSLTPRDARARRRLKEVVVHGAADTPRCFTIVNADGGASVMLLGEAAAPDFAADISREALQERCAPGRGAWGAGRGSEGKAESSGPSSESRAATP